MWNFFKVKNKDIRTTSAAFHIESSHLICAENQMTGFYMKCNWRRFGVFVFNFEQISHIVPVFLLLTLNK